MNRTQFQHARRVVRSFHRFAEMAIDAHLQRDDHDLARMATRFMHAEYLPLQAAGVDTAAIYVNHCMGPSSGAFGPSLPTLAQHPEELRRWLSHFRMARYFRKPCQLPRAGISAQRGY